MAVRLSRRRDARAQGIGRSLVTSSLRLRLSAASLRGIDADEIIRWAYSIDTALRDIVAGGPCEYNVPTEKIAEARWAVRQLRSQFSLPDFTQLRNNNE